MFTAPVSPLRLLLIGVVSISCYALPPQASEFAAKIHCPVDPRQEGYLLLQPGPSLLAWVPRESRRELFELPKDILMRRYKDLKERVGQAEIHDPWQGNRAAAERLRQAKNDLTSVFAAVQGRAFADAQDVDEVFSLLATEPSVVACISMDSTTERSFVNAVSDLNRTKQSDKSPACSWRPINDPSGVAIGLLEAEPAVVEQEVSVGQTVPMSRKFVPLPAWQMRGDLVYEIELDAEPPSLTHNFRFVEPPNRKQTILQGGTLAYREWNYSFTPIRDFGRQDVKFGADVLFYWVDPRTRIQISPVTKTRVPLPLGTVAFKIKPGWFDQFIDSGNRWFGFVGWLPTLWALYEIIRRFLKWRKKWVKRAIATA